MAISGSLHVPACKLDGLENIHVSGAAAGVASNRFANFFFA
jgi:hypothetical protein